MCLETKCQTNKTVRARATDQCEWYQANQRRTATRIHIKYWLCVLILNRCGSLVKILQLPFVGDCFSSFAQICEGPAYIEKGSREMIRGGTYRLEVLGFQSHIIPVPEPPIPLAVGHDLHNLQGCHSSLTSVVCLIRISVCS